jgi:RNA polymerase sigma-70 factor (ECF subfamily)
MEIDFQQVYQEFQPKIRNHLARLVGDFEAEDLTQEVFVRVHKALPAFRGESSLSTWIHRIATNTAIDHMRRPAYQRVLDNTASDSYKTDDCDVENWDSWTGENAAAIEEVLHRKDRAACFCDFLEKLPDRYRVIVTLNQIADCSAKEIADMLGLDENIVKTRLQRGKKKLLEALKRHCRAEDWL